MSWNDISWIDILGYVASIAVFATFCMSTMMPLRYAAIASNGLFVAFGYFGHIYPVFILHVVLLPVNIVRLMQIKRLIRDIQAHSPDEAIKSLLPFMQARRVGAGTILVRKGDVADRLFYLFEGELEIEELNKTVIAGAVIGEIGVFASDQRRMATVKCKTDCRIYEMTQTKAKELYFQDPSFGYAVLQLIITRLLENQMRAAQLQRRS